jgi:hypothetical protein
MSDSSYITLTICYANNNNIDDPTCIEGHHSPGVNSNILECMTAFRDVEEAETYFPVPDPG